MRSDGFFLGGGFVIVKETKKIEVFKKKKKKKSKNESCYLWLATLKEKGKESRQVVKKAG